MSTEQTLSGQSRLSAELAEDLAFVRDLAEAGESAPLLSGRFLAWWGGLVGLTYLAHFLVASGNPLVDGISSGMIWSAFLVIGLGGYALLSATFPRNKPGASSVGNRVDFEVWKAGGFAMAACFGTAILHTVVSGDESEVFGMSLPIVFALYAVGLLTSGYIARQPVLTAAGYAALGVVAISTWFAGATVSWLIASIGAFLTVFLPGLLLMGREPKSVV